MPTVKTILIIPTFNEVKNVPILLSQLFALGLQGLRILVVDDNSPDGTGRIAEELKQTYPGKLEVMHRSGKQGLGTAYIQGFNWALIQQAHLIGQMDADFSHEPQKFLEMHETVGDHDLVVGSRYIPGGNVDRDWAFWRKGLSAFGNLYARTILGLPERDVTGGFRLWRADGLAKLPLERVRSNGYVFQVEMLYLANKFGLHIQEIPIYFAERQFGESKMSLRIQLEAALRVWLLKRLYKDL